jgi:hypothetical protein
MLTESERMALSGAFVMQGEGELVSEKEVGSLLLVSTRLYTPVTEVRKGKNSTCNSNRAISLNSDKRS